MTQLSGLLALVCCLLFVPTLALRRVAVHETVFCKLLVVRVMQL